jgi:type 1 glutamine amidotransferase
MHRLVTASLGLVAGVSLLLFASAPPAAGAPAKAKKKLLYYTRSQGFEHGAVKRQDGQPAFSEKIMTELGEKLGYEIVCSKDGNLLAPDKIDQWDGFIFYATGRLDQPGKDNLPPMPPGGKEALLKAIENGKGFVGVHAANDAFRVPGKVRKPDPFIAMIGGEFEAHGKQQKAKMVVVDPKFPGLDGVDDFVLYEEWYIARNLAPDMHVILVQDTQSMEEERYRNLPPYPATWARKNGKGRVFYTSMGHREDVWNNPTFQKILMGGIRWAVGDVDYDVPANIGKVTPEALKLRGAQTD